MERLSLAGIKTAESAFDGSKSLSVRLQISCVIPTVGTVFLVAPIVGVLQGVYATYFGLSLSAIAAVLLVARLFDAITMLTC